MKPSIRTVLLLCASLLLGACDNEPSLGNAEHAERAVQAFLIAEDFDQWDTFYHSDVTLNGSALALTVMKGTAQGLHHSFPDVTLTVVEQVVTADKVVTRFVLEGTHEGYFSNIKPTGRRVVFDGISMDEFRDGRIQTSFMLLDLFGLGSKLSSQGGGS